jgi:hypothetical protein
MTKRELIDLLQASEGPDDRLVYATVLGGTISLVTMEVVNVRTVVPHMFGCSSYVEMVFRKEDSSD